VGPLLVEFVALTPFLCRWSSLRGSSLSGDRAVGPLLVSPLLVEIVPLVLS
jgi:hypothetical protein